MRAAALLTLLTMLPAAAAAQEAPAGLGGTIRGLRVEVAGVPTADPDILQLIETHIGAALSMRDVRESIDHLVGIGRFQDVQVFAEPHAGPAGVMLRWTLVPVQRIAAIEIVGSPGLDAGEVRSYLSERLGTLPLESQIPEIEVAAAAYYAARGYRQPQFSSAFVPDDGSVERGTLLMRITAGPRTTVRQVTVRGETGGADSESARALELTRGAPYNPTVVEEKVARLEQRLRDAGYYEADVEVTPTFDGAAAAADLVVDIERGPRVRVVFAGDELPENRRDELVPIRQERSVDLDLLEDASRNIEEYLRQQGYRAAEAPYVRETRGDELILTFTVRRGPLHRVTSVDIDGGMAVPRTAIAPLLSMAPGEPYNDARAAAVAAAITELYRVRGFARATVNARVQVLPPRDNAPDVRPVAVTFAIAEGVQTLVGTVEVEGAHALDEARVRGLLELTGGQPFYRPRLEADRDRLERLYQNEGFPSASVEPVTRLHDDGARVDVAWRITEGERVLVDRVLVRGNVRTSADLIRREIVIEPGSPLGADALIESQRRLAALGLFRRVRLVELPHAGSLTRDILVDLEEAPVTSISYGGGLEAGRRLRTGPDGDQAEERIDLAPRGFIEVTRRNLWGKNRSASIFTRVSLRPRDPGEDSDATDTGGYGFNEYRVVGTFREPRLLASPGDLMLTGFLEQAIRSSFNFSRRGVRLEYARRLDQTITVSGRYTIDRTRLFDAKIAADDQLLIDRLFPQVRLSTLTGSALRDTRDDVVDPARGTLLGSDVSLALRSFGSEVGFIKSSTQGFVYTRLPGAHPFTLVAGGRVGVALGFARVLDDGTVVDDVPASERFFAGGDSTVRGFVLDRLGTPETLNNQGFPSGGSGLVVINVELRSPYWKGLGAVGFFDAGNVFRRASDIALDGLRPAAGGGLRYRSPLGPLRFDIGFNLDRRLLPTGARERGAVFHLSLGQAF